MIVAVESARILIDSGYTMCVGAASAKERIDVVIRSINKEIPGRATWLAVPRWRHRPVCWSPASRVVSGAEEVRRATREICGIGADVVKLILSGESILACGRRTPT